MSVLTFDVKPGRSVHVGEDVTVTVVRGGRGGLPSGCAARASVAGPSARATPSASESHRSMVPRIALSWAA